MKEALQGRYVREWGNRTGGRESQARGRSWVKVKQRCLQADPHRGPQEHKLHLRIASNQGKGLGSHT